MPRFEARSSAHTIRKRYVWTQIFLNTEKENLRFRKYPATCGWSNTIQKRDVWTQIFFKYGGKHLCFRKYPATCGWSNTIQKRDVWTQIFFKYGGKHLCFRKYPATCGWSNTSQKRDVWTQMFFKYGEKISVLENIRLRMDGQIRFKNATCGHRFFLNTEEKISDPATCGWSNTIQKRDVWT